MEKLFEIYNELRASGTMLFDYDIDEEKAATMEMNGCYAVFVDAKRIHTRAEENYLVAHEAGHVFTGTTHTVYSPLDLIEKHERKADIWAIRKLIPRCELHRAMACGYTEIWQLAEYFDVPEDFAKIAVSYYKFIRPA